MSFIAPFQLCFPRLTPAQWDKTKEPACYRVESSDDPQFMATLELLMFVAQRSLKSLAQEGKLERFVDELKSQLDEDAIPSWIIRLSAPVVAAPIIGVEGMCRGGFATNCTIPRPNRPRSATSPCLADQRYRAILTTALGTFKVCRIARG